MKVVARKLIVDEQGKPKEVILAWSTFCEIAETLGWDLDEEAQADLRETRRDLEAGNGEAFQPLTTP
jgi:PHD/YefM family antitoxin component YafN of YafNO toxin-antitoxin module